MFSSLCWAKNHSAVNMAAPFRTLCCSVLRHGARQLNTTCTAQAGQKWRQENGLSRSGSEFGPLTDLPDWSFADGRPAPPLKGHLRRRQEREDLARRIVMLSSEVDRGIETWAKRQEEAEQHEEHRKSKFLKPKGRLLTKKVPKS
ncbi:39S ribosomal protein L52, mitochondrial [Boleophthalmus pectinirostris]|uniref:39S ribosomal protein L52, mitochondrial n=1 Tax=Boleophthalmus pectinirostris TaxID=150288 RepID=UPI00242ED278|nr:39S ribosomal protein L52, mitochondrial [Boleophthalmus pectinirostris]